MQKFKQHLSVWLFAGAATLFVGLAYTASDFFTAPTQGTGMNDADMDALVGRIVDELAVRLGLD